MNGMDENTALSILFANTKRKKRRTDLITIARSCEYLVGLYGSRAGVAERVGLHTEMIRQFMNLLTLPEEIRELISARKIDRLDVAYRIATLGDKETQLQAAKSLATLTSSKDVRDVIRLVKKGASSVEESARRVAEAKPKGLHIFVMDFDDDTYGALQKKARQSGTSAPELVQKLVKAWLDQETDKQGGVAR